MDAAVAVPREPTPSHPPGNAAVAVALALVLAPEQGAGAQPRPPTSFRRMFPPTARCARRPWVGATDARRSRGHRGPVESGAGWVRGGVERHGWRETRPAWMRPLPSPANPPRPTHPAMRLLPWLWLWFWLQSREPGRSPGHQHNFGRCSRQRPAALADHGSALPMPAGPVATVDLSKVGRGEIAGALSAMDGAKRGPHGCGCYRPPRTHPVPPIRQCSCCRCRCRCRCRCCCCC